VELLLIETCKIAELTDDQKKRYAGQLAIAGMNQKKQRDLLSSSVLVLAGYPAAKVAANQLIKMGTGKITICPDKSSNINFSPEDLEQNPDVDVTLATRANRESLEKMVASCDLVLETCNDWQEKLSLSDFCMRNQIPMIHCGGEGLRYQIFSMIPGKSACLRCAFPVAGIDDFPHTTRKMPGQKPELLPVHGMIGSLMALEAIKVLTRLGVSQGNEMWKFDGFSGEFEVIRGLDPRNDCPDCGAMFRH